MSDRVQNTQRGSEGRSVLAAAEAAQVGLPYLELSRAMLRAHHNALAMVEANRTLAEGVRDVLRRQQELAVELAEAAWRSPNSEGGVGGDDRAAVFARAADAVRELGEAMIAAQLKALKTLRDRSDAPPAVTVPPVPSSPAARA